MLCNMQVYRGMNVGSAKIDPSSCPEVPHHLLDVVDVTQPFSALEYHNLAVPAIEVSPCLPPSHALTIPPPCRPSCPEAIYH